jgi:hypothetical protein
VYYVDIAVAPTTSPDSSMRTWIPTVLSLVITDFISLGSFGRNARIASADDEPRAFSAREPDERGSAVWTELGASARKSWTVRDTSDELSIDLRFERRVCARSLRIVSRKGSACLGPSVDVGDLDRVLQLVRAACMIPAVTAQRRSQRDHL